MRYFFLIFIVVTFNRCSKTFTYNKINVYNNLYDYFINSINIKKDSLIISVVNYSTIEKPLFFTRLQQANKSNLIIWDTLSYDVPGISKKIICQKSNILLINKVFNNYYLYKILKKDRQYSKIYEWDASNSLLIDSYFENEANGYVIFRNYKGNSKLYTTKNGGQSWEEKDLEKGVKKAVFINGKLFLLHSKSGKKSAISIIDLNTFKSKHFIIDLWAWDLSVTNDEKIYLIGIYNNEDAIYTLEDNNKLNKIKTYPKKDILLSKIHVYNDFIGTLFSKNGSEYLYYSFDKGKTWHLQMLYVLYLKNPMFYKDKEFYAITGANELLIGKFIDD